MGKLRKRVGRGGGVIQGLVPLGGSEAKTEVVAPRKSPPPERENAEPTTRAMEAEIQTPATVAPEPETRIAAYFDPDTAVDPLGYLDREVSPAFPFEPWFREDRFAANPWDSAEIEPLPAGLYVEWDGLNRIHPAESVLDALFSVPEMLVDCLADTARAMNPGDPAGAVRLGEWEDQSLTSRLLDIEQTRPRLRHPFTTFVGRLLEEEADFLLDFEFSVLNTPGFEYGEEDVDLDDLENEQGKVLWDAVKSTYLSKYRVRGDEKIRSHDMYFRHWRGVDFVVMPVLLSGYAYYRGLDKKIRIGDGRLRFHLEPVGRLRSALMNERTRSAMLGMEIYLRDAPVRFVVSVGIYDGDPELDFIGVGTRFSQVRRLLALLEDE